MNFLKEFNSKFFKPNIQILLFSLFLFLIIFPLSNSINFYQNDDWVYYRVIKQFLTGNYEMPGYIEALFYTQGLLGTIFAKFFGIDKLPVLTLLLGCLAFFIFTITINNFYLKNTMMSLLIGLILFVSPLFVYSILGFMSEIYFIFFLVLGFYFFEKYTKTEDKANLIWFDLSIILGFFVRQLAIFSGIASVFILIKNKKYKESLIQFIFVISLYLLYTYIIPKTGTMQKHSVLAFENLLDLNFISTTIYIELAYATLFIFPLLLLLIKKVRSAKNRNIFILVPLALVLFMITPYIFNPKYSENSSMYYLKNTVNQDGFFYGSSLGEKYNIYYHLEIYRYLDILTKIGISIFVVCILFLYKKLFNFYFIFSVLYLGFMLVLSGGLYDRYFLPIIPAVILFILNMESKLDLGIKIFSVLFTLIVGFYSYNFAMDFVILNNKMWEVGKNLNTEQNVAKDLISAGNGWNRTFQSKTLRYKYSFYFGPRSDDKELNCCFKLYDSYEIFFPFNIFKESKVYLYKRSN